jgi:hypothetical protein
MTKWMVSINHRIGDTEEILAWFDEHCPGWFFAMSHPTEEAQARIRRSVLCYTQGATELYRQLNIVVEDRSTIVMAKLCFDVNGIEEWNAP